MSNPERRQFYRARCQALVDYKQVDKTAPEQSSAEAVFSDNGDFALINELQRIDQECAQVAGSLSKADSNLLDYLKLTHRKIDQLSQIVLSRSPGLNTLPQQTIDLSEQGLGFCGDRFFYLDSILALRLVFLPHYQSVVIFTKVLRCEPIAAATRPSGSDPGKRDTYHIAVEFLPLAESTRRVIAQQVLRAQRQAKLTRGSDSTPYINGEIDNGR